MFNFKHVLFVVVEIFFAVLSLVPPAIALAAIAFSAYSAVASVISGTFVLSLSLIAILPVVALCAFGSVVVSLWMSSYIDSLKDVAVAKIFRKSVVA